jgi:hypothetical protein
MRVRTMRAKTVLAFGLCLVATPCIAGAKNENQHVLSPECWRDWACVERDGAMVNVRHKASLPADIARVRYAEEHCPGVKGNWKYIHAWQNEVQTTDIEIEKAILEAPFEVSIDFCRKLKSNPAALWGADGFYTDPRMLFLKRGR